MTRKLSSDEIILIRDLVGGIGDIHSVMAAIHAISVEELSDGGMGSLKFLSGKARRRFGSIVQEKIYKDLDGIDVVVTLTSDNYGDLYELDIWKVDFSRVKKLRVLSRPGFSGGS